MWRCSCGRENTDIGNFCVFCGAAKNDVISAQVGDDVQWYYYKGSNRCGPVAAGEIANLLRINEINRNTLVWKAGMTDWVPLNQTALNTLASDVLPPIPMQAVSDKYAWALATVPFLCDFFLTRLNIVGLINMLIIIGINCAFLVLDINEIKKSGNNPGHWIWLGLAIVPVYLFVRASKVNRKYGYAITYMILFSLNIFIAVGSAL